VDDEHLFDEGSAVPIEPKPAGGSSRKKRAVKKPASASRKPVEAFERKYTRLEAVISEIEKPDLPLEELITKFEEGVQLIRECTQFLHEAKLRIEEHIEEKDGTYVLKGLGGENLKS